MPVGRHRLATVGVIVLMCFLGYHVVFGANGLFVYQKKRQESRQLQQEIQNLQQQNGGLEQRIKSLKSDPQAIEKEARERLKYARPGEVVYTLQQPKSPPLSK
jgi:cell division protein FtsB